MDNRYKVHSKGVVAWIECRIWNSNLFLRSLRSSAQQGRAVCEGRLIKVHFPKLLLHEELVGSSSHAVPLDNLWGVAGWALTVGAAAKAFR